MGVFDQEIEIERIKAPLVAKGFPLNHHIDHEETFVMLSNFTSIGIVFSLSATYFLSMHQMGVETMFLNGTLDEDIRLIQNGRLH